MDIDVNSKKKALKVFDRSQPIKIAIFILFFIAIIILGTITLYKLQEIIFLLRIIINTNANL